MLKVFSIFFVYFLATFLRPEKLFAHEIYVLNNTEVNEAIGRGSLDFIQIARNNSFLLLLITFFVLLIFFITIKISYAEKFQKIFKIHFDQLNIYTLLLARVVLGASLILSAFFSSVFSPQFSLIEIFGAYYLYFQGLVFVFGVLILSNVYPKLASILVLFIFFLLSGFYGLYMLNYLTYFGFLLLVIVDTDKSEKTNVNPIEFIKQYRFLIFRVSFGLSLISASFYAKFLHPFLALDTIEKFNLTTFLPFEPSFIVLGAWLIESLLGILIILGLQIRLASTILIICITLSGIYFKELFWPHLVLVGAGMVTISNGYDKYTLAKLIHRKNNLEPLL